MPDPIPFRPVLDCYQQRIETGELEPDAAQLSAATRLNALAHHLSQSRLASKKSALGWIFAKRAAKLPPITGLYIFFSFMRRLSAPPPRRSSVRGNSIRAEQVLQQGGRNHEETPAARCRRTEEVPTRGGVRRRTMAVGTPR